MRPLGVRATGLVTAVGRSAPAACAAMRASLSNFTDTRFVDDAGEWIVGGQVPFDPPLAGLDKLAALAAGAVAECLAAEPGLRLQDVPLALCVAEKGRPGRLDGLDDELFAALQDRLGAKFRDGSVVIARGRTAAVDAIRCAERMIHDERVPAALVAAADSLLDGPALAHHLERRRLLTSTNPAGFVPGEAGAALLLGPRRPKARELAVLGAGTAVEKATIDSTEPLRADGLVAAVRAALADAAVPMADVDWQLADVGGGPYGFKEASLVKSRVLRTRREVFPLWHVSDALGETGAATGLCLLAAAGTAAAKGYAPGATAILTLSDDDGARAAALIRWMERA